MVVRKLRLKHGWSQEQLADLSGLSIRTIQRIERGHKPGLESLKCLAAVFETNVSELQQEQEMTNEVRITDEEQTVIDQVRAIKGFYSHLMTYVLVIGLLFAINLLTDSSYIWAWWPAMGWGIGIINHGLNAFEVFNLFGAKWERRQIEKRLGRKL
ncbi:MULTISPECIES: helix-turn-helix domain-containing protein [Vibrio]|jgi:transcriptional regulator with XRE-family HTH domain|uniref:helix-turn-helix domain-containing protein n=1 Tax=Vibrio TaxID=662 RepID=UPI0008032F06|nr:MULTISPECIES: helix-turn-helix domain-containing protein [Vibrio]ANP64989.1 XRE family transcriptional regulator [Vibrio alginolyticus]EGQ9099438.1 helix-turn-helix domain-containing protein [Vibrio alginolyticus]EGR0722862.1 helix-turn-helix domain-containing protein [Vibrio alginolyticus]EIO9265545.1 helix-turn-helix domain-containing protein [Vibrio alginolyticus]EJE3289533.1 helix-turn-helix domain-containing protein [Vibrio alginolyticus]